MYYKPESRFPGEFNGLSNSCVRTSQGIFPRYEVFLHSLLKLYHIMSLSAMDYANLP